MIRRNSIPTHDEVDNYKVYESLIKVGNDYLSHNGIEEKANKINSFTSKDSIISYSLTAKDSGCQYIVSIDTTNTVDFDKLIHEINEDNLSTIKDKTVTISVHSSKEESDSVFDNKYTKLLVKACHTTIDLESPVYGSGILKQGDKLVSFTNELRNKDKSFSLNSNFVSTFDETSSYVTYHFVKYISQYNI